MQEPCEIDYIEKFEAEVKKAPRLHVIATKTKRYARIAIISALIIAATLFLIFYFKQSSGKDIPISWMLPFILGVTVPVGIYMFVMALVKNLFPYLYAKYCREWLKENDFDIDRLDDYSATKYLMYSQIGETTPSYDGFTAGLMYYKYGSAFKLAKRMMLVYFIRYPLLCIWIAFIAPIIGVTQALAHGISLELFLALVLTTAGFYVANIVISVIEGRVLDKRMNDPAEEHKENYKSDADLGSTATIADMQENKISPPHICPKCGNSVPADRSVCPICEFDTTRSEDEAKQALKEEIDLVGCGIVWGAYNRKFTLLITILDIMYKVFIGLFIALAIGCIIAFIVFGINEADTGTAFTTEMILAVLAAVFFSFSDCVVSVHKCIELKYCTAWLRKKGIDGSKTSALAEYSYVKNKYTSTLTHQLDLAYYTENPKNTGKRIALHILDSIIQIVFYVSTAVILVYILCGANNIYSWIAVLICLSLPDFLSYIIRRRCAKTPETWLMTEKYPQ